MAMVEQGKLYEARKALTPLLLSARNADTRTRIKATLDRLNQKLFFSRAPSPDAEFYLVKSGDVLWNIAKATGNSVDLIKMVNQKSSDRIRPKQRLKIIKGAFSVLVDKSDFTLTVFLNDHYIKQYTIGLGKNDSTPQGTFVVDKMVKDPPWTAPDGRIYPFGDKRNILGTRWIGFEETREYAGYGIHGTWDDKSIGTACSNGCIRMTNREVEEVFAMLRRKATVTIRK